MIITMIKMTMQQQIAFVKPLGNLLKHNLYWYLKNNTRGPWHWSFCPNQSIWGNAGVTVASVKATFCSKISSQTFYFSSFSFLEIWTWWKHDSAEGSREILLFFIEHCSSYCHINCFRFSVQIVFPMVCSGATFKIVVGSCRLCVATGR